MKADVEAASVKLEESRTSSKNHAYLVASGIFLSRIAGLVRESVFAHFFGNSDAGDAFKAAIKIPNFLQNLFGEGILSASFIPVYAGLLAQENREEANKVAGTIASLLALITSLLVAGGVLAAPYLIDLIAPGFHGEKKALTIHLVQILFPATGLLVMSAWCLGILNSHRKFFLSYVAPVMWNLAIIVILIYFGRNVTQSRLAVCTAWGAVLGSSLQFAVQLPTALRLLERLRPSLHVHLKSVRTVIRNFFPVVVARGVVQVSAYIDNLLASLLPTGAVSSLAYAQIFYLLPVSLFGMSVSAAELPAMSSAVGTHEEISAYLRKQLNGGLRQIAYFIVPSVMAFLFLGDVIVGAVFQSGVFHRKDTIYVWGVLAGATVGLLAVTLGRLYSSAYYALKDTRTPLKFAVIRVTLTTVLGFFFALKLPVLLHLDISWGTAGLTSSAGMAGWVEFLLLRKYLNRRIGFTGLAASYLAPLWVSALTAAAAAWGLKILVGISHPRLLAVATLIPYGLIYLAMTSFWKVPESRSVVKKLRKFLPL